MTDRPVRQTGKDEAGDITSLANAGADIENDTHTYYVPWKSGRTEISVVNGPTGKYLRTQRDGSTGNNLDELPDP